MLFREWFAVFCVLGFLGVLFLLGVFPSNCEKLSCEASSPYKIKVEISGAVEFPGVYEVDVGSSVGGVLRQIGIKKTADRRQIYFKKKLLGPCQVHVPEKNAKKTRKKRCLQVA